MVEAKMDDGLNNLTSTVASEITNLRNITTVNAKLAGKIKVELYKNKVLTNLLSKNVCGLSATNSDNENLNKWQRTDNTRGHENHTRTEEKQWDPSSYFWTHGYKFQVG